MTLVLTVFGHETLWLIADRRLSYGSARPPIDDAIKIATLDTVDGACLLAYAGLGATSRGMQPSDWRANVLRGRGDLTLEQSLGVLADAATRELPRHLHRMPGGAHSIVAPGFARGLGPRLYSIDNLVDSASRKHFYRYTRYHIDGVPSSVVRIGLAGTGGVYLSHLEGCLRPLLRLVKANDRGKVSESVVAREFARLNLLAYNGIRDGSVGSRCVVIWRKRIGGGAQLFFSGEEEDPDGAEIPAISSGWDLRALLPPLIEQFQGSHAHAVEHGFDPGMPKYQFDETELARRINHIPRDPDERLR